MKVSLHPHEWKDSLVWQIAYTHGKNNPRRHSTISNLLYRKMHRWNIQIECFYYAYLYIIDNV